jgi:hypothetical protein
MSRLRQDTMARLRAANPARVRPQQGLDPVAQATLARIMADSAIAASPLPRPNRLRSSRLVPVLLVLVLGAGGALAATDPLGWWSSNPGEAKFGANPAMHVPTPSVGQIRCHRSTGASRFRCSAQRDRCARGASGQLACVVTGNGLAYTKIGAIPAPAGSSFSRERFLSFIAAAVAHGKMSATHAARFRADLARVPDSFFTEYRVASRYGTYSSGASNSRGQPLVPPPGEPNLLVCETASPGLSCQDLNGDLAAPIGAGVYSAQVGAGWRVAPAQRQHAGLPPGIHFTPAEYQVLIDMLRYATVTHSSSPTPAPTIGP